MPSGSSSCGSCSTSSGIDSDLPTLRIRRQWRSRVDYSGRTGSLGRNAGLADYDRHLLFPKGTYGVSYGNVTRVLQGRGMWYGAGRQAWITNTRDKGFFGLFLYNQAGVLITDKTQRDTAHSGVLMHHDGSSEHFEVIWDRNGLGQGRLVALADRNGNAVTIDYVKPQPTWNVWWFGEFFRIKSITDAHNRVATVTTEKKNNWWVITQIDLPNNESIKYNYGWLPGFGAPAIRSVDYPDGSKATWSGAKNAATGIWEIDMFEPAASRTSRRQTLHFTSASAPNGNGGNVATPKGMTRKVENGAGEMSYANNGYRADRNLVYTGGNKAMILDISSAAKGLTKVRRVTDNSWQNGFYSADPTALEQTSEKVYSQINASSRFGKDKTDAYGRFNRKNRNWLTQSVFNELFPDGTREKATYNNFDKPLLYTDRLGRVTKFTYDASGNVLSRTRGFGNPSASTRTYVYNSKGQITEERDPLYDPAHPDLHNTKYEYNSDNLLVKKIESADIAGGVRPTSEFTWDTAGRLYTSKDPLGRVTTFTYDAWSRHTVTTYHDGSTEETIYGAGVNAGLVVARINRNGIRTEMDFDLAGRAIETRQAVGLPEEIKEVCEYLYGTSRKLSCTKRGEKTEYVYDNWNRMVSTIRHVDSDTQLATSTEYDTLNRRRSTTDAYGRRTFYLYDYNDRLVRTVTETVPGGLGAVPDFNNTAQQTVQQTTQQITTTSGEIITLAGIHIVTYTDPRDIFLKDLTRDQSPNPPYLITDRLIDAVGQTLLTIDARGIKTLQQYDVLGRVLRTFRAVTTPEELLSETDFDKASNVLEIRHPRHFAEKDAANNPIRAVETYTYTGRNLRASHTVAAGHPTLEATESWSYNLDRTLKSHTDFRGNADLTLWHICCGRLQASIQRDGESTAISNNDFVGNVTHTAVVSTDPSQAGTVVTNWHNPADAETLAETTTRFDGLNRPVASTRWLQPLGEVNDHARASLGTGDIPIATDPTQGLTTSYSYDEDLTDGQGIDAEYAAQFAVLATRGTTFGANANGYASKVTNPEGESSVSVQDGLGRTVMTINPEGHISTTQYDQLATPTLNAAIPVRGQLLKTVATDANGNTNASYAANGLGGIVQQDGINNFVSQVAKDANGNTIVTRDANGLGHSCTFDALNRKIACADLQEQAEGTERKYAYNAHNAMISDTDAENLSATYKFDERDRMTSSTDRNNLTTGYTFDANNNRLTLTDPRTNTRTWEYDERNLNTKKLYPDGESDRCLYEHDALRRMVKKTQQDNTEIRYTFDLASRMTSRDYFNAGASAPESTDTFTYDAASRLLTTHKGRYDIRTAHTYAEDSQPLTETLTIDGRDYTMSRTYDPANRVKTHTFADGKVKEWSYDNRNVVTTVTYDGDTVLNKSTDAGYRCTSETFGNDLVRSISFGRQDNLRTNDRVRKNGNTINELNFDYTYAADKNVKSETSPSGLFAPLSFNVTYDGGNRVKTWNRAADFLNARESQSWNYDDAGNWNATTIDGDLQNRTNNASDELANIEGNALSYDSRGNLLEDQDGQKYTWDIDNRIATIDPAAGSDEITHQYDALSRRVHREFGNTEEVLLWWGKEEYAEHENIGSQPTIQNDLHANPTGLNTTFGRALEGSKHDIQYFHKNYLDHVYAVSDDRGDIIEHYRYTAFGEPEFYNESGEQLAGSAVDNDILWNVKRYSEASGLYMYLYRHYEAEHGRWPSRDPIMEEGGVNLYGLVGNEPLKLLDLLGLIDYKKPQLLGNWRPYGNHINGEAYHLKTDRGRLIRAWKGTNGNANEDSFCHGFTFDSISAPGGPYSVLGNDIGKVLNDDDWYWVPCSVAEEGIMVFISNTYTHSAKINTIAVDANKKFLESSKIKGKDRFHPIKIDTVKANLKFGKYFCFVSGKPKSATKVCVRKGDGELWHSDWKPDSNGDLDFTPSEDAIKGLGN